MSNAAMPPDTLIGQLFMVGFYGTTPSPEIVELIQQQRVGGIILFSRNVQNAQQVLELTQSLQRLAKEAGHSSPLLIAIDQENGMVQRLKHGVTQLPGNMALGATGSEQLAYEVALATGRELSALGINMNLAPVVDVNNNPANPVIGTRSFGEEPSLVGRLGAAQVRGYREAGVISTLKHFPGHGDTSVDSHLALPIVPHPMQRLEAIELIPFKLCIDAGADCVMTAHVAFPALTGDTQPATLSPVVLRDLLRQRLGFDGVIISDCLEMNAISTTVGVADGSVQTLQASADLVLVSHHAVLQREAIAAVRTALEDGQLALELLQQAVQHVQKLKERLSWEHLPSATLPTWVGGAEHAQLRDRAYALSTTLVNEGENLSPLLPIQLTDAQNMLVLFLERAIHSQVEDQASSAHFLVQSVQHYHPHINALIVPAQPTANDIATVEQAASMADVVVLVTVNAYQNHNPQQAAIVQNVLTAGKRVIGIAASSPYDVRAFPHIDTWLLTYEPTRPALEAVARVLFGEEQAQGRLPVTLPAL